MGQQSIPQPSRRLTVWSWTMLLFFFSALLAQSQTSATTVPLILPSAIVYDAAGNLYIAETGNHVVRKVDSAGNITTIAGTGTQGFGGDNGPATAALLDSPQGLALDANNLYIADTHNHRIRKLDLSSGTITTIAGSTSGFSGDNGPATAAQLNLPTAVALGMNNLYIADMQNHRIRKVSLATGTITTIAGNGTQGFSGDGGPAINASIDSPAGLAVDADQNVYLADTHNHRVRRIDAATDTITTIAGSTAGFSGDNGPATAATLALPHGLSVDGAGNIYIADTANHRIRRIDAITGDITTIAGNGAQNFLGDSGPAVNASLDSPRVSVIAPDGLVTLTDTANQRVRQLDAQATPDIHTIVGITSTPTATLTLIAPSALVYGTGQLTATLSSPAATGSITFTLLDPATATGTTLETSPVVVNAASFDTSTLAVGSYSVLATYTGDASHSAAQSQLLSFSIAPRPLVATPDSITLLYGQSIPALTGTLTGELPQDESNLIASFTISLARFAPVASYPISVAISGSAAKDYAVTTAPGSVTIAPAPTITTLAASATSISTGTPITFTAQAASTTAGTPTGTITVKDGATTVFTATTPATWTTSSLAPGTHTLTTTYSGDQNFIASTSTPLLITVISGPTSVSDFTLAPSEAISQTIPSGGIATFNFNLQIQGTTLSSPVTLAATGLPAFATASFNPAYLPPGTTPNTFTLTISTSQATALGHGFDTPLWALLLFPFVGLGLRRRIRRGLVVVITLSTAFIFCSGCGSRVNTGSASGNPPRSYTITVTGTATGPTGSVLQHSTTVNLLIESATG